MAAIGALAAMAVPASAAVVINEVESDDAVVADFVELTNTDAAAADIGGYVIKDSDDGHAFTIPAGTMLAPGGYYVADVNSGPGGFGLGSGDSARLFAPADLVTPIDSYSWTSHAAATYGRCPDGTGPMGSTSSSTRGAANACPVPALAWPGSDAITTADDSNVFGGNLSGLAYQPSGSGAPGVLWAVRNSPSTLYRLIHDGTKWVPDTANGWGMGKQLLYPNGAGVPDAEGVTLAGGDANGIYVSVERNDSGGQAGTSRPAVLRYDISAAGMTLTATREWDLTADLPGLGANAGLEAVTWMPDDVLVAKGFYRRDRGRHVQPGRLPRPRLRPVLRRRRAGRPHPRLRPQPVHGRLHPRRLDRERLPEADGAHVRARDQEAVGDLRRQLRRPHRTGWTSPVGAERRPLRRHRDL